MKLLSLFLVISGIADAQYTKLLDFSCTTNGCAPFGSLISDGTFLYGMTSGGGANGKGTIFKIKPDGTGYLKLLDFAGTSNGNYPLGSLISDGIFLYGMTYNGGTNNWGVVFKIKPDGTGYLKLLDFADATNGANPVGSLISDGTFLYGMTQWGGINSKGVIFKIKSDGTGYLKLLDFAGTSNGYRPYGDLISDGTFLHGMTQKGGTNDSGTVFKIKLDGTGYLKLLDFAGNSNGSYPVGSLISDGTFLYGMTSAGGTNNIGVVFKIKLDGTGYLKLLDFSGSSNGSNPAGSLMYDGTLLYGMTGGGGINNQGTLFKIKPDGTGYLKLLDFAGTSNGSYPAYGSLISDSTFLYGMTYNGGSNNVGTVFKFQDTTTGIAENNLRNDFSISPNPTSGVFTIQSPEQISAIEIVNLLGQKVSELMSARVKELNSTTQSLNNSITLDLSSQPNGVYFLQLITEKGIARKKIVISR